MLMVFVDDSEEKKPRRTPLGHLVGVGAVAVPEDGLAPYAAGIRALRAEFGVPADTELKWSPGDGSWLKTGAGKAACTLLRERTLDLAAEAGATSIVLVWARGHLDWQVPAVREKLLRWLYDKVSTFLGRRNAVGVVVADEPGGGPKDRAKWLRETLPLTDEGTGYTRPEQIVLPIVTAPSHHIPHLQLADLVTAATVAAVAGNRYALDLMPRLIRIADRLPDGQVGGAGLTVWPQDKLMDLYWHLYGERVFAHHGTAYQLGPFAATSGLTPSVRPFLAADGLSQRPGYTDNPFRPR